MSFGQPTKHVAYANHLCTGCTFHNTSYWDNFINYDYFASIYIDLSTKLQDLLALRVLFIPAIKKRMEKYIDDVVKNVSNVREKLQVITIDVMPDLLHDFPNLLFLLFSFWSSHSDLKSSCILMNFSSLQNILHRQMPGCQKGTACDRERMNRTKLALKSLILNDCFGLCSL